MNLLPVPGLLGDPVEVVELAALHRRRARLLEARIISMTEIRELAAIARRMAILELETAEAGGAA
jgi:hypothetical protein